MKKWFSLFIVVAFIAAVPVRAEEPAAGDKKEAKDKSDKPKKLRLVKPWSDLTTLNDEQKAKISEIHAEFVEKMNQLRDDEEATIMALLTEENKVELATQEAEKRQATKERNAARRAAAKAGTTQPSDK